MYTQNQVNLMSQSQSRFVNHKKLASAIIHAETENAVDEGSVKKTVENTLGAFYTVEVSPNPKKNLCIAISCEEEMLERNGLMQLSVFNVLRNISQKHNLCIVNVENEFLPDYA